MTYGVGLLRSTVQDYTARAAQGCLESRQLSERQNLNKILLSRVLGQDARCSTGKEAYSIVT